MYKTQGIQSMRYAKVNITYRAKILKMATSEYTWSTHWVPTGVRRAYIHKQIVSKCQVPTGEQVGVLHG